MSEDGADRYRRAQVPHRVRIRRVLVPRLSTTAMSKSKFDKAVAIVQALPKEGPIQPTQEEQLYVSVS